MSTPDLDPKGSQIEAWLRQRDNWGPTEWRADVETWESPALFASLTELILESGDVTQRALFAAQIAKEFEHDEKAWTRSIAAPAMSTGQLENMRDALYLRLNDIAVQLGYNDRFDQDEFCISAANSALATVPENGIDEVWMQRFLVATAENTPSLCGALTEAVQNFQRAIDPNFDLNTVEYPEFTRAFKSHFGDKGLLMTILAPLLQDETKASVEAMLTKLQKDSNI